MKEKQHRRGAPNSRTASEAPAGPAALLLLPLGRVWTGGRAAGVIRERGVQAYAREEQSGRERLGEAQSVPHDRERPGEKGQ